MVLVVVRWFGWWCIIGLVNDGQVVECIGGNEGSLERVSRESSRAGRRETFTVFRPHEEFGAFTQLVS